jgi:hypothetical protein
LQAKLGKMAFWPADFRFFAGQTRKNGNLACNA